MSPERGAGSPGGGMRSTTAPSRSDAGAGLGADEQHLLGGEAENLRSPRRSARPGRGRSILLRAATISRSFSERQVAVGQGLGLDPPGGADQQDHALAGGQRPAHLVAEVHVARRVDEVQDVSLHPGARLELDGDARSRSRSIESRYCARMSRPRRPPQSSSMRVGQGAFPWSMWAMMAMLREARLVHGRDPGRYQPRHPVPERAV